MHCCHRHHKYIEPTKPEQRGLSNLDYLELLNEIEDMRRHAEQAHKRSQWMCNLFHDWRKVVDREFDGHAVCHRCGKYKPTSWANPGGLY